MIASVLKMRPELDDRLGRLIFSNLCPYSYNAEGRAILRRRRAKSMRAASKAGRAFIEAMARNGFYRVPFDVTPDILIPVVAAYNAAITDPEKSQAVMSLRAQQAGLSSYCRSVEFSQLPILEFLLTAELRQLASEFYGGEYQVSLSGARRTLHIPPEIAREYDIYSNSWHCDREPSHRIKLFIALSDIDEHSGPLHILPRPRTKQILQMGFGTRDNYRIGISDIEDPKYLALFTGPAGTALFVNVTQCLHRAGIPSPARHRDIAEIQFT